MNTEKREVLNFISSVEGELSAYYGYIADTAKDLKAINKKIKDQCKKLENRIETYQTCLEKLYQYESENNVMIAKIEENFPL